MGLFGSLPGNFGCVKRGFLTLPEHKGDILVAVKTLHGNDIHKYLITFTCADTLYVH